MELDKILKKVAIIQAHPNMMTSDQIAEWMSVLRGMKNIRIDDVSGATPTRCAQGCLQSKFSIYVASVAKIDITLTKVHYESKKYSVSSATEYFNGAKSQHGAKEYNTIQREFLRQQELFQQQQHATMRCVAEHHHQHMMMQHHHNVVMHHHHNF
jgi:hypothetical protein